MHSDGRKPLGEVRRASEARIFSGARWGVACPTLPTSCGSYAGSAYIMCKPGTFCVHHLQRRQRPPRSPPVCLDPAPSPQQPARATPANQGTARPEGASCTSWQRAPRTRDRLARNEAARRPDTVATSASGNWERKGEGRGGLSLGEKEYW